MEALPTSATSTATTAEATSTATDTDSVPFLQDYIKDVNQHLHSTIDKLTRLSTNLSDSSLYDDKSPEYKMKAYIGTADRIMTHTTVLKEKVAALHRRELVPVQNQMKKALKVMMCYNDKKTNSSRDNYEDIIVDDSIEEVLAFRIRGNGGNGGNGEDNGDDDVDGNYL